MTFIRAILFDLDGTLILSQPNPASQFVAFCERLGHSLEGEAAARRLERWQHRYWADRKQVQADVDTHGEDNFWRALYVQQLNVLGIAGPLEDYAARLEGWFSHDVTFTTAIPDDIVSTLRHLRGRDLIVGLVSNRTRPLTGVVTEHGFDGLFDFTLSAGEAASWKPEPGIFLQAASLANAAPEATAYVGDNYYADIVGARNAGLVPILIDRRDLFPDADCRVIREIGELIRADL
jgi:putative hydrolase of the HAD superfamily